MALGAGIVITLALFFFAFLIFVRFFHLAIPLRGLIHEIAHPISPARLKPDIDAMTDDRLSVAWVGHATVLINFFGTWILTDPALSNRIGITTRFGVIGPRRITAPALTIDELPQIDIVAITHAHMDHLDIQTLERLDKNTTLLVPPGLDDLVGKLGFNKVVTLGWNREVEIAGVTFYAFAPKHWGKRNPWEKEERGYNSYLISRNKKRLLYAGDTAYTAIFGQVAKERPIDAALFNLGAYEPKWFRKSHATSEEVWRMFNETGAKTLLPIHWHTFIISQENIDDPMAWLRATAGKHFDDKVKLKFIGEIWSETEDG